MHEGNCKTVNKEIHIDILRRLRDAVRRKRPGKDEPISGLSFTVMLQHTGQF